MHLYSILHLKDLNKVRKIKVKSYWTLWHILKAKMGGELQ